MKINEKDELNYKQAYLYMFNQLDNIIKKLILIQRNAENICIDDTPHENIEIDTEEILKNLINKALKKDDL